MKLYFHLFISPLDVYSFTLLLLLLLLLLIFNFKFIIVYELLGGGLLVSPDLNNRSERTALISAVCSAH